jgi:2-polyprenyl-3-methyl-5-hydroxy-6-metoxy-1,4-benzoquinol methylase
MTFDSVENIIGKYPKSVCCLCQSPGNLLYADLNDYLFNAQGQWSFKVCSNSKCKLIWLDPAPKKEDIFKAYKQYYTHSDQKKKNTFFRKLEQKFADKYLQISMEYSSSEISSLERRIISFLAHFHPLGSDKFKSRAMFLNAPLTKNAKLLEIGCGSGEALLEMSKLGWQVQGLDFDETAVLSAREKGLSVQCGELRQKSYSNDSFDAIYMNHVIEHVYEPKELLEECFRLLKPSGYLVIVTPNTESLGHRTFNSSWRGLEPPRHLHIFNSNNLSQVLLSCNFKISRVGTLSRGVKYIISKSYDLLQIKEQKKYLYIKIRLLYFLIVIIIARKRESENSKEYVTKAVKNQQ